MGERRKGTWRARLLREQSLGALFTTERQDLSAVYLGDNSRKHQWESGKRQDGEGSQLREWYQDSSQCGQLEGNSSGDLRGAV